MADNGSMVCTLYLLKAGHDTPSCGRTEHSACRTLPYTLQVFYNYTQQQFKIFPDLNIITDKDLMFDTNLLVSFRFTFSFFSGLKRIKK